MAYHSFLVILINFCNNICGVNSFLKVEYNPIIVQTVILNETHSSY